MKVYSFNEKRFSWNPAYLGVNLSRTTKVKVSIVPTTTWYHSVIFGCISAKGVGVFIEGTMDVFGYIKVLVEKMTPSLSKLGRI